MTTAIAKRYSKVLGLILAIALPHAAARSHDGHDHAPADQQQMIEQMRDMHEGHDHGHDFDAMDHMAPEEMRRVMALMTDIGLALPPMDSHRGRHLFLSKGCVVCHSVNDVGGEIGPSLNAADMPSPMNAFEFAARMWRGAPIMAQMQEDLFGEAVSLNGQDLADLIAFAHDEAEQAALDASQIPDRYSELITQ